MSFFIFLVYGSRSSEEEFLWFIYLNKVYNWFEKYLEIQMIVDDITSKYIPPHVNIFIV
jgi:hypothetical protein